MAKMSSNKRKHKRRWILKKSVRMSLASFLMIFAQQAETMGFA